MRNSNTRARCTKKQLTKSNGVVRTYNDLQEKFADLLTELFAEGNKLQEEILTQLKKVKYEEN